MRPGPDVMPGYQAPSADRYGYSETYLRGRITGALGGRAAEEIIYGDVTTGAESDMEQASNIARQTVGRWGMSPAIGPVSVLPASGQESPYGDSVAPATRELVDTGARRIIEECYEQALATLRGSRDQLDRLAHTLLERETLEEDEAYAAAGIQPGTAPTRSLAPGPGPDNQSRDMHPGPFGGKILFSRTDRGVTHLVPCPPRAAGPAGFRPPTRPAGREPG